MPDCPRRILKKERLQFDVRESNQLECSASHNDASGSPKIHPFKCLIANDESIQLGILKHVFEKVGMNAVTAINGHEAFEIICI